MSASEELLYRRHGPVALYLGDATQVLSTLPESSVDCVVTSPPYWGHRDYRTGSWGGGDQGCPHPSTSLGVGSVCPKCGAIWSDPQYGLEPTLAGYLEHLIAVFDQLARVLTPAGTCWLNLGDSYSSAAGGAPKGGRPQPDGHRAPRPRAQDLLAPKNLIGVPWRAAFALQERGWWLRQAIVWHKPNAMPESVRDRPASSHEYLFLLTRSPGYFFDLDAIRLPPPAGRTRAGGAGSRDRGEAKYAADPTQLVGRPTRGNLVATGKAHTAAHPNGRNPGSVWSIPTRPTRLAHYATYPLDLPLRAVAAGCRTGGVVLDPFSGTGTTGLAALHLHHPYVGIDVHPAYHDLALHRLAPLLRER